jgi:DNA-binding HxlR family transcriptional regulator
MGFDEIDEFLRKKGAVEVIIEIGSGSATYQNINEAVLASSSTVSNRLNEAVQNELVEVTHRPTDYGTQKRYTLTDSGNRIYDWVLDIDLEKEIRELRRVRRDRDNKMNQLLDYVNRDTVLLKRYSEPERRVTEEELKRMSDHHHSGEKAPDEMWEQRRHDKLHGSLIRRDSDEKDS